MKAIIGPLTHLPDSALTLEFQVLLYTEQGETVTRFHINVPYTPSTNTNQLLPLAKQEVISEAGRIGYTLGTNDIISALLQ